MSERADSTISSEGYLNLPFHSDLNRLYSGRELAHKPEVTCKAATPVDVMVTSCKRTIEDASLTMTNIYNEHPYLTTIALLSMPAILNSKTRTLLGESASCVSGRLRYAGAEALENAINKPYQLRVYEWNTKAELTGIARDSRTGKLLVSARDAVARVTAEDAPYGETYERSIATAFNVSHDGRFLTNYHVIKDFPNCKLVDKFGWSHAASVLIRDEKNDLAVLQLNNKLSYSAFKPLKLSDGLNPGYTGNKNLVAFGHSNACRNLHMSKSAEADVNWPGTENSLKLGRAVIPMTIRPGNSGSPVLDSATGKVVGIAQAVPSEKDFNWQVSIVVPSTKGRALLEKSRL